jgi:16S rRNA (adenine1518-N6/adenine1519-N6)-dimethyltransferase
MHRWTSILKQSGLAIRSGLGQNFIVDEEILQRIAAELPPGADVVEIGSGPGNLTSLLARRARKVWAFEVDAAWQKFARERVNADNVEWHLQDGERFAEFVTGHPHGISNLPYSAYLRLTLALFAYPFARICLTLQKDVFEKFSALPGSDAYGPLAVLAQGHYRIRKIFGVPRSAFCPAPRVDSTFFCLEPLRAIAEPKKLHAALRSIFSKRRKKATAVGIESDRRVEELEPATLLQRADQLIDRR